MTLERERKIEPNTISRFFTQLPTYTFSCILKARNASGPSHAFCSQHAARHNHLPEHSRHPSHVFAQLHFAPHGFLFPAHHLAHAVTVAKGSDVTGYARGVNVTGGLARMHAWQLIDLLLETWLLLSCLHHLCEIGAGRKIKLNTSSYYYVQPTKHVLP